MQKPFSVDNILSESECNELIQRSTVLEKSSFATIRNNSRGKFVDKELSTKIFDKLKDLVPQQFDDWKLSRARSSMFLINYLPGGFFKPHYDGGHRCYMKDHVNEVSEFTFVIYLNESFDGGCTCFYDLPDHKGELKIKPQVGRAVVFPQRETKHRGEEVENGEKWILQGMLMYEPPEDLKNSNSVSKMPSLFEYCNIEDQTERASGYYSRMENVPKEISPKCAKCASWAWADSLFCKQHTAISS